MFPALFYAQDILQEALCQYKQLQRRGMLVLKHFTDFGEQASVIKYSRSRRGNSSTVRRKAQGVRGNPNVECRMRLPAGRQGMWNTGWGVKNAKSTTHACPVPC